LTGSILTLNAGSSSLKFAMFDEATTAPTTLSASVRGEIERLDAGPHLRAWDSTGDVLTERRWPSGLADAFTVVLGELLAFADAQPASKALIAVGHRVVHGGPDHRAPERVTPAVLSALQALIPLDPLHMPHSLAPIVAIAAARPDLAQVVCFDTAFHQTMPQVAQSFALPRAVSDGVIRRYGFHGLSYEYIASRLPAVSPRLAKGRVIVAHLGSGASLCAMQAGRSIETTTGFSVLEGLVMATRCGAIDPGVLLYLGRLGHSFQEIEDMLYHRSGLLGVSGLSGDVRVLMASGDAHAADALALFSYRAATSVGALASALGGLDGIVFTAGVGEHAPPVRAEVCKRLAWLGVAIDEAANAADAGLISTPGSSVEVRVIPTDEEAMIARHTMDCVQPAPRAIAAVGAPRDEP
jgi:acetate kinase